MLRRIPRRSWKSRALSGGKPRSGFRACARGAWCAVRGSDRNVNENVLGTICWLTCALGAIYTCMYNVPTEGWSRLSHVNGSSSSSSSRVSRIREQPRREQWRELARAHVKPRVWWRRERERKNERARGLYGAIDRGCALYTQTHTCRGPKSDVYYADVPGFLYLLYGGKKNNKNEAKNEYPNYLT